MTAEVAWRPTARWDTLRRRAELLRAIREYFTATGALEVDTPTLTKYGSTEPALANFTVPHRDGAPRFLHTSPEFAMKRLLAAGSGDIFQICHAYRQEEHSRLHQEEFALLEWYRVGRDHHELMNDVAALLRHVGIITEPRRCTYAELWQAHFDFDPHTASTETLAAVALDYGAMLGDRDSTDRALLLDFLFGCQVLPALPAGTSIFVHDFPLEHAAYARLREDSPTVAERFELIIEGVELANGFHELCDANEQRARQVTENERRRARGLEPMALDEALLAALGHGLPSCAGVAVGIDRLLMNLLGSKSIVQVVAFGEDDGVETPAVDSISEA